MKNPLFFILFIMLCLAFGVLALCQDKVFALVFAIACMLLAGYVELANKK